MFLRPGKIWCETLENAVEMIMRIYLDEMIYPLDAVLFD